MPTTAPSTNPTSNPKTPYTPAYTGPVLTTPAGSANPFLRTIYISFEKEKVASDVMRELSDANVFVAMNPGASIENEKVVELLVPWDASNEMLRSTLSRSFSDLVDVTSTCNVFRVAVRVDDFKRAKAALRGSALRVNRFDRVSGGLAYFNVCVTSTVDAETISNCLVLAKIEADCIEPVPAPTFNPMTRPTFPLTRTPATAETTMAWPSHGPYNNPSFPHPSFTTNPNTGYNIRFICDQILPIIGRDLLSSGPLAATLQLIGVPPASLWKGLVLAAQCWTSGLNPNPAMAATAASLGTTNPYGMTEMGPLPNGTGRTIQRTCAELTNPASPLCTTLRQMGIEPTALYTVMAPFTTPFTPATPWNPGILSMIEAPSSAPF